MLVVAPIVVPTVDCAHCLRFDMIGTSGCDGLRRRRVRRLLGALYTQGRSGRAWWTERARLRQPQLHCAVVLAEDDSCCVLVEVLGARVRVHGDVRGAAFEVGVLVVAHRHRHCRVVVWCVVDVEVMSQGAVDVLVDGRVAKL